MKLLRIRKQQKFIEYILKKKKKKKKKKIKLGKRASFPPTKQSPAPVSLIVTTDAEEMHSKKKRISFQICSTKPMWMKA